jgi:predicted phosphodiesterase
MRRGKTFDQFLDTHEDKSRIVGLKKQLAAVAETRAERKVEIGAKAPPYRFGVLSCTHFGSLYEEIGITSAIYDWFAQEGVKDAYHCGDITEGCHMRKGHENSLHKHGFDSQLQWVVDRYPYRRGITTHLITGNHDASHMKNGGADIGAAIARQREDVAYFGADRARVTVDRAGERNISIDLIHPDGGVSYALSYKPQKIIESLEAGSKPDVLLIGHFHKAFFLPGYRGVAAVMAGCTQRQTDFMARNGLAAHVGAHIVEARIIEGSVIVTDTWRGFYP